MRDQTSKRPGRVTQEWTAAELEQIFAIAEGQPRRATLLDMFPGRTVGAIRQQLFKARRQLGVPLRNGDAVARLKRHTVTVLRPDDPGLRDNWQPAWARKAAEANDSFLAALRRQVA